MRSESLDAVGSPGTAAPRSHGRRRADSDRQALGLAMSAATLCMWECDEALRLTRLADPSGLLGTAPQVGTPTWSDLVHAEDRAHLVEALRDAFASGCAFACVFRTASEPERSVRAAGTIERDAQGGALRLIGIAWDVTELRETERARAELEARLKSLLALSADLVWEIDRDFRFTRAEGDGVRRFGLQASELIGRRTEEIERVARLVRIAPDDAAFAALRAQREPFRDAVSRVEMTDGMVHYYAASGEPVFDADGTFTGYRGVTREVTAQVKLQGALSASERDLKLVLDSVPAMVGRVGRDQRFTYANERYAELYERPVSEIVGRTVQELLDADQYAVVEPHILRVLAGERVHFERTHQRREGEPWTIAVWFIPDFAADGEVAGYIGLVQNVTAERAAQRELRALNETLSARVAERTAELDAALRELEAMSYSISHDLKTPLRAIDGHLGVLREELGDALPPQALGRFARISENARFMGGLIEGLLQFTRLARKPLELREVEPATVVASVLGATAGEVRARQAEVTVEALPVCRADPAWLREVYAQLFANALKFVGDGQAPRVRIGARETDGRVVYYVSDEGIGFDSRYAERLFGVFERLNPPWKYGGVGIGLAIVRRIVERHGGHVWAESQPGQGATFCFTLGTAAAPGA